MFSNQANQSVVNFKINRSILAVMPVVFLMNVQPAHTADATFNTSCLNIRLSFINRSQPEDGILLSASCRNNNGIFNGFFRPTQIELNGYDNVDGVLTRPSTREDLFDRSSTFQTSCENITIADSRGGGFGNIITARCRNSEGLMVNASVTIQDISNDNGTLVYNDLLPGACPLTVIFP
jgi:hypothetical protein